MALKFKKEKLSSLMGYTEVVFTLEQEGTLPLSPFKMTASPYGVDLRGELSRLSDTDDLQSFADWVSQAWTEHKRLRPKIEITDRLPEDML